MPDCIIDTHAHLYDAAFASDLEAVLERATAAGICGIILVSETLADAEKNLALAGRHPILKPAAGLYPEFLDFSLAEAMQTFIRRNRNQLIAVGEVGLDYWIVKTDEEKERQAEIFKGFVDIAQDLDLPLNVHSRSAGKKAVELLLAEDARKVQLHAFDGRAGAALRGVEAGYFFSIPPSVVRSRQKQKLVKNLPLSCLLLESDSPVLGPLPGRRNEPANIQSAITAIAEIKGVHPQAVIEACARNTQVLYGNGFALDRQSHAAASPPAP